MTTIVLVLASLYHRFTRVGVVVLFLHDVSDVFVDLLKLSNYLRLSERVSKVYFNLYHQIVAVYF